MLINTILKFINLKFINLKFILFIVLLNFIIMLILTKKQIIDKINQNIKFNIKFSGFSDELELINSNLESRVDLHSMYFLYKKNEYIPFPYNNEICEVIGQCDDGSIECEFTEKTFNGDYLQNKIIITFEFADYSNYINYNPIFTLCSEYATL